MSSSIFPVLEQESMPLPNQPLQLTAGCCDDWLYFYENIVDVAEARFCQRRLSSFSLSLCSAAPESTQHNQMPTKPIPEGFHAITPYLFAQGASRLIDFISAAFEGELISHQKRPGGAVMHATMRIRDSMLMLADPTPEFGPMPSSIYLYVTDCDAVYQRTLSSGGISVFPMMTLPSGERYGGVKDPCGNIWWIATHVEDVPPEQQERRWKEFKMPRPEVK
jgi:PhnB protein